MTLISCQGKFRGSLLGVICGDVLGAPLEGLSAEQIRARFGRVTQLIPGPDGVARYTDDTQMTLALGRSLIRCGTVEPADCAASYAAEFDPARGYGRSAVSILQSLREGSDWRMTGRLMFPGGSFGNGAAMRIAPVGLVYGTRPLVDLRLAVQQAVCATHTHPEAVEGALVLARVIGRAKDLLPGKPDKLADCLPELLAAVAEPSLAEPLLRVGDLLQLNVRIEEVHRLLGSGVRSSESVPFALYLAMHYADDPLEGLYAAVNFGGDTDTVAAMTGSELGALHGEDIFPTNWLAMLEPGGSGLPGLLSLADDLFQLYLQSFESGCPHPLVP